MRPPAVRSGIQTMARSAPPPPPRLHGRAAEIAALSETLDRVASGRPATVLIEASRG
jgi:hypothetical protein